LNSLETISVSQQTVLHEVMLLAHQNCIHRHSMFLKVVCSLFSTRFVAFTERDSRHTQNITVLWDIMVPFLQCLLCFHKSHFWKIFSQQVKHYKMLHCDQTACGAAPKQHRQYTCELGHNVTVQKKKTGYMVIPANTFKEALFRRDNHTKVSPQWDKIYKNIMKNLQVNHVIVAVMRQRLTSCLYRFQ